MQELVCAFLESVSEAFPLQGPVYEFGYSPTVDSAGRPALGGGSPEGSYFAFDDCEPTEIDRLEDLVRLPFASGAARTVVSVHTLEHVFEPRQAVEEMIRILAPGGLLIICSASTVPLADRPDCYWQPTPRAVQRLLAGLEATLIGWQGGDPGSHTLFGIGCKAPVPATFVAGVNRLLDCFQKRLDEEGTQSGWWQRLKRRLTDWTRSAGEKSRRPLRCKRRAAKPPGGDAKQVPPSPSSRDYCRAQFVLHLPVAAQFKHELLATCLPEEGTGTRLDTSR